MIILILSYVVLAVLVIATITALTLFLMGVRKAKEREVDALAAPSLPDETPDGVNALTAEDLKRAVSTPSPVPAAIPVTPLAHDDGELAAPDVDSLAAPAVQEPPAPATVDAGVIDLGLDLPDDDDGRTGGVSMPVKSDATGAESDSPDGAHGDGAAAADGKIDGIMSDEDALDRLAARNPFGNGFSFKL